MLRSTGNALAMVAPLRRDDAGLADDAGRPALSSATSTATGKADLYVFNGTDWTIAYLGMLRSTGSA